MRLLPFLLLVIGLSACAEKTIKDADPTPTFCRDLAEIKKEGVLRALTDASSTSYFIYKGNPVGFEYEILKRFAKEIGVRLEMVVVQDLDSIENMLRDGRGDVIAANYNITDSRQLEFDFSRTIMESQQVIIQAIPKGWDTLSDEQKNQWKIDSIPDLTGRTITVREQSSFYPNLLKLKEDGLPIEIELSPLSTENLIKQVSEGEIELTVADKNVARLNMVYHKNLIMPISIAKSQPIAWAVRNNSPIMLLEINRWLKTFKQGRAFSYIKLRYFKSRSQHRLRVQNKYSSLAGNSLSALDGLLKSEAKKLSWDWRLLAAIIRKESNFNPRAESVAGAAGLMQLMPATAKRFGADSLFDPTQNIQAGVLFIDAVKKRWLSDSLDSINMIKFTLASYNAGVAHVKDAQALAKKYGANPKTWDEVAPYLLKLSKPEFCSDPVVKHGYCRGIQPVQYVERVLGYWQHYQVGFSEK